MASNDKMTRQEYLAEKEEWLRAWELADSGSALDEVMEDIEREKGRVDRFDADMVDAWMWDYLLHWSRSLARAGGMSPEQIAKVLIHGRDTLAANRNHPEWTDEKLLAEATEDVKYWRSSLTGEGFVLDSTYGRNGWFPLGQLSIIHGPSGAGKSTLMYQLLEAVRNGAPFLGHPTTKRDVLVIAADRTLEDAFEQIDSMGIARDLFRFREWDPEIMDKDALKPLDNLLWECDRPPIVFIEGLDFLSSDPGKQKILRPLIAGVQKLARHHGCAIIGSWGTPKIMSTKNAYTNPRDAAVGSASLSRGSSSMLKLSMDYQTYVRHLHVDLRRAGAAKFQFRMDEQTSRLVQKVERLEVNINAEGNEDVAPPIEAYITWRARHPMGTNVAAAKALNVSEGCIRKWKNALAKISIQ
jgi:hypothetical protein